MARARPPRPHHRHGNPAPRKRRPTRLDANVRAADSEHHTETLYVYSYQRPQHTTWRVIEILRAIHAYEYDTCRIEGWLTSRAYHYCAAISHRLTQQLPGYLSAQPRITTQTWPAMAKEWHPENR